VEQQQVECNCGLFIFERLDQAHHTECPNSVSAARAAGPPKKKPGRKKGDPRNLGRPKGVSVKCWWGCGAIISGTTLRGHWANCPKRPKS
jgi:hypothetical protein